MCSYFITDFDFLDCEDLLAIYRKACEAFGARPLKKQGDFLGMRSVTALRNGEKVYSRTSNGKVIFELIEPKKNVLKIFYKIKNRPDYRERDKILELKIREYISQRVG